MRELIAYYSRRGQTLMDGRVENLRVGNTEILAGLLQMITGADCFRIEPEKDYPEDYYACMDQSRQDLMRKVRPKLKNCPESIGEYEVIYLGFPNYWGTMPAPVFSFLEQYDFSGKVIRPFGTYDRSGMGSSGRDLKRICPDSRIGEGLFMRGTELQKGIAAVQAWAYENGTSTAKETDFSFGRTERLV